MTIHPRRSWRATASIATLFALLVVVPIGLVATTRSRFESVNPLRGIRPPWSWEIDVVRDALGAPLRDDAVINLLIRGSVVSIWVALLVVVATTVAETMHMVRHRGLAAPHVRGLGWAQGVARWIAMGLVAVLPINSLASGSPANAGDTGPIATAHRLGVDGASSTGGFDIVGVDRFGPVATSTSARSSWAPDESAGRASPPAGVHTVRRGESIYAIAAAYADGDESRTIEVADEILDLNLETVMNDGRRFTNPALIQPGWVLRLPVGAGVADQPLIDRGSFDDDPTPVRGIPRTDVHAAPDGPVVPVVVEPGDTLSEIASEHLGDADAWPTIWEQNRGDDMGDGRMLDDPNTILPGWEIDVPSTTDPFIATDDADTHVADSTPPPPDTDDRGSPDSTDQVPPGAPTAPVTTAQAPDPSAPPTSPSPSPSTSTSPSPVSSVPARAETVAASTTTVPVAPDVGDHSGGTDPGDRAPRAPSPIRLEYAALLAAGVLTLVGVRRRRALRSALPHARIPPPPPDIAAIERRLRIVDPGERAARIDIAVRAAAHRLADTGVTVGTVRVAPDGALTLRLTDESLLAAPWVGWGASWSLPASVPIELLSEDARKVGQPCLALVTIGIDSDGQDVLIDLEAAGLTTVESGSDQTDEVVRAIGSGLATSLDSEAVHLVVAALGAECLFDHPNARRLESVDAAITTARSLASSTLANERSTFELRSRRTGGDMWEPAIALLANDDRALEHPDAASAPPGHGFALVAACAPGSVESAGIEPGARLVGHADRWVLSAFGEDIDLAPIGVTLDDVADVGRILTDAARPVTAHPPGPFDTDAAADPLRPVPHDVVVGLMGPVTITSADGVPGVFERSKTVELIAWLVTHRERATRVGARTALWEMDVRDATFANVVSEARRALGRMVPPPGGEEWLARTLNQSLPLHERVVTDAELIEHRVGHARLAPPAHAIDVLRPAVEMIRGLPFAGTSYLWPDADGITSSLVLLATTAAAELAGHALSIGDTDLVFWSTGQGLKVLPGHEELIGLRMRAHARAGDLAGVRAEWESYERVIMADAWSDGDPAPKLLSLRRELLTARSV